MRRTVLPIEDADYFIKFMTMPPGIYAFVHPNDDGTYLIYLDPRRDRPHQIDDYTHELWHIVRDDFYNGQPIYEVEHEVQEV